MDQGVRKVGDGEAGRQDSRVVRGIGCEVRETRINSQCGPLIAMRSGENGSTKPQFSGLKNGDNIDSFLKESF